MSDLTPIERLYLEKLFDMDGGYVLNFSDRTFNDFVLETVNIDITENKYQQIGTSKAKRLRQFWKIESNHVVGKLIDKTIDYVQSSKFLSQGNEELIKECRKIASRLKSGQSVAELDSLLTIGKELDNATLLNQIREALNNNQPEAAIDRLHTFCVKYVRDLCQKRGIEFNREKSLHSMFGEYVKKLRESGFIESTMTDNILKYSITLLDSFNGVRNNKSLAHDNPVLNYEESLLIFNNISSLIRFVDSVENRSKIVAVSRNIYDFDDDLPE